MKSKVLLLFILNITLCFAQETINTRLVSSTQLDADTFIGADDFNHLYYIKNNTLYKQSPTDTLNYTNIALGKIHTVDVHNPFKVVVFYKDFNAVVVLDSKLNAITNVISFNQEIGFNNAVFLSYSSENNLWIFADDNRLHLYNFQYKQDKIQSQPITFYKEYFEAIGMVSNYKKVWVLSPTNAVLFNQYGNYLETYPLNYPEYIFPYQKGFLIFKGETLTYKSNKGDIPFTINIPKNKKDISLNKSALYIFDGKMLHYYVIL